MARRAQLSNRDAGKAVDAFLEAITDTLKGRGEVTFTGFGKFSTANRAARTGVNPRNPTEKVHIPAATVPKFSAGSGLKIGRQEWGIVLLAATGNSLLRGSRGRLRAASPV